MKRLIVGLGNPGKKYQATRHNIGFMVLDEFSRRSQHVSFTAEKKFSGFVAQTTAFLLLKPTTYMNLSGDSIRQLMGYFKIAPENTTIIHDDLDIPFGMMKIQRGKSSAGHRGVESSIEHLGTNDFWRIRVGIAGTDRHSVPGEAYVLQKFSDVEKKALPALLRRIADALHILISEGPEKAAQIYNQKP